MTVGFNVIPPDTEVSCTVAGIKALQEVDAPVANPRFTFQGQTITFPVSLRPRQYLVSEGDGKAMVYDANWHLLETVTGEGKTPQIAPGSQTIEVNWETDKGLRPWARIRLKAVGSSETVTKRG